MADDNNLDINIGINPTNAEAGARRTSAAVGTVVSETKDLDASFRRLKSAIDPMYAAQDKYNKTLAEYDRLLAAGKLSQDDYAAQVDVITRAYNNQVAAIEKNSSAAKRASAEKAQALLKESQDREAAARRDKGLADEWVQQEKRNTTALKRELNEREVAQRAANLAAVQAAREAAQASVAAMREGGTPVTKAAETQIIRDAAAAAKQANRERLLNEQETDNAILASYRQTYEDAKALAIDAANVAATAAKARQAAEVAVAEAIESANSAAAREAMQAYRAATVAAAQAAQDRTKAEKDLETAAKEEARATEAAAVAAAKQARELHEIRAAIDPAYASTERYNVTMQKATQLLMSGALASGEWTRIQKQAAIQMEINARQMGRMNQTGIQLGYQMQDVTASIASGINPLVIFAQQSGQVAYAMQGMGGMAGKVASIMGGVWFQAILAGITILGMLWMEHDKGKKSTLDLMDAESRRAATVRDLTDALEKYTRSQHEANLETENAHRLQVQAKIDAQTEASDKLKDATTKLTAAQAALKNLMDNPTGDENYAATLAGAQQRVNNLQQAVNDLNKELKASQDAAKESAVSLAKSIAGMTDAERQHQFIIDGITQSYLATTGSANDYALMLRKLQQEDVRWTQAKKDQAQATRDQAKAENQLWKSRNDVMKSAVLDLQGRGFATSGNTAAPGPLGHHPGMGDQAHWDHGLDVNIPGAGTEADNAIYKKKMDNMVQQYQAAGFRVLWNGKVYSPYGQGASYDIKPGENQHRDHAHLESQQAQVGQPKSLGLAKGIAAAENAAIKELESAEQKAARELAEAIDTKESALERDDTKTNEEKLAEVIAFEKERVAAIVKGYGAASAEAERAKQHELAIVDRYNQRILAAEERRLDAEARGKSTIDRGNFNVAKTELGGQSDAVDNQQSQGIINERQALGLKAQILEEEYTLEKNYADRAYETDQEYYQKKLDLPNQDAAHIAQIQEQMHQGQVEHLAQMREAEAAHLREVQQLNIQAANQKRMVWMNADNAVVQSLTSGLQQMWMRQETFAGMMIKIGDSIAFSFIQDGVKMVHDWIKNQIFMTAQERAQMAARLALKRTTAAVETGITAGSTAAHVASEGVKTASTVASAATQTAVTAATGKKDILTSAAKAAASVYNSIAKIPVVGPFLAPAMAAGALYAVMRFTGMISAEGGAGEITKDGQLAQLHKKEMVLPAWIAEPMRKSIAAGNSSRLFSGASEAGAASSTMNSRGGDANFYYQPKHTNMGASFDQLLREDGRTLRRWIKNEVRNGGLHLK